MHVDGQLQFIHSYRGIYYRCKFNVFHN